MSGTADPERRHRDVLIRFVGFTAAAILWALSLLTRDDVGVLPIAVQVGWTLSATLTGVELVNLRRRQRADTR